MIDLFKSIRKKINHVVWTLFSTGVILLMLGVLIVWTDFVLKLVIGMITLVIGYGFIYSAYKLWTIKSEIEKHFKF